MSIRFIFVLLVVTFIFEEKICGEIPKSNKQVIKSNSNDSFSVSPLFQQIINHYKLALESYVKGDYPNAIIYAQKALCLDPLEEECYLLLKQAKAKIGIIEKESDLKDASVTSFSDQQKIFQSGMQFYLQKDYDNAKRRWEFLKVINDTFPELKRYLNQLSKEMGAVDSIEKINNKADKYFQRALKTYNSGDKKHALAILDTTIQIYPQHVEAVALRGRIRQETDEEFQRILEHGKALYSVRSYNKAVEIWKNGLLLPTDVSTLKTLIQETQKQIAEIKTVYLKEVDDCTAKNDNVCALEKLNSALELTPDDTALIKQKNNIQLKKESERNSLYQAAIEKWNGGDYSKAAELFSQVLSIAPDYSPAREYLVLCNEKIRKQQVALTIEGYRKKALDMEQHNNLSEALYYWNQVLTIDSSSADADNALKRLAEKLELKQKSISIENMYSKSIDYYKNGKYQEARDTWNRILEKDPVNTQIKHMLSELELKKQALLQRGDNFCSKGQWVQAIKEYNDALRTNPGNQSIQEKINFAEKKKIESEEQQTVFSGKKVMVNQKENEELFNKGIEFYMAQKFNKALESWNAVLQKDPDNARAQSYINNLKNKMKKLNQL